VIVITGASGLIGARLAQEFANDSIVVGLDIARPEEVAGRVDWVETDLTEDESVAAALDVLREKHGPHVASVIHLAAYYDFSGEPSPLYEDLTVGGTRRLLRSLREKEFDVEQFVFSSSLLVMEPREDEGQHVSELSATRAEWDYPQSKLRAERVIREEHGPIPFVILRIAGVYDEHCHSVPISQQIRRIHEKKLESFVFPGNADHGQALVHLDDLADCFRRVVDRRHRLQSEELFLIAEPDVMSYSELQDQIGQLVHGTKWPTIRIPKAVAKAGAYAKDALAPLVEEPFIKAWMIDLADDHYQATIAHARIQLGWEPQHRLRDTLPKMIGHLHEDPLKFYADNGLPVQDVAFEK
jgi:nucleoside-diphosphate-sugar epimerase